MNFAGLRCSNLPVLAVFNEAASKVRFASTYAEREAALKTYGAGMPGVRYQELQTANESSRVMFDLRGVVWDDDIQGFKQRSERYYQLEVGKSRDYITSSEITLPESHLMGNGIYLNAASKRLYLPDGRWIDGPTGEMYTAQGVQLSTLNKLDKEI